MTETKPGRDHASLRAQARQAADEIERSFPPEGSAPAPMVASLHLGADAMKHWLETGQDLARFYNDRLARDFTYMTELSACRTPADLTALWCRAASETIHDYADQIDRVMAISLNAGHGGDRGPAE